MSGDSRQLLPRLDDQAGPARRMGADQADALMQSVLQEAALPAASSRLAPARARWAPAAAAAAVLLAAGGAAAYLLVDREPAEVGAPPVEAPAPEPAPQVEPRVDEVAEAVEEAVESAPEEEPAGPLPRRPRPESADDLLQLANSQRGAGQWRDAHRTYIEVTSAYPNTRAAYVATVSAASLRLDHLNNAQGAARLFRAALRNSGPLEPEVRWGLARAYRRMSSKSREANQLRRLIEDFPQSPFARQAQHRLETFE